MSHRVSSSTRSPIAIVPTPPLLSAKAETVVNVIMKAAGFTYTVSTRKIIGDTIYLRLYRYNGWTVMVSKSGQQQEIIWPIH